MHADHLNRLARVGRAMVIAAAGVAVMRHSFTLDWQVDDADDRTVASGRIARADSGGAGIG